MHELEIQHQSIYTKKVSVELPLMEKLKILSDAAKYDVMGDFELVDELSVISGVAVPNAIEEIRNAEIRHNTVCEVNEMKAVVKQFLGM